MMIDPIKTEVIKDLLISEFPGHLVKSTLIGGQQYYQIRKARSTVAILRVDPGYFAEMASADEVRQNINTNELIAPLKQDKDTVNIVLLTKHSVRMNQTIRRRDRTARVFLDLLSNWQPIRALPKFTPQRFPSTRLGLDARYS
jgi:hypothetical protein